jgi:L-amino acid N-acyltransferase YncA
MDKAISIRMATVEDAADLLEIYAPYVRDTAISFEYDVPSLQEFSERIAHTLTKYPYLVAVEDGHILGYTYASVFKPRPAYDWAVETTIYLHRESRGRGVGRQLYSSLEEVLRRQNIQNLNACIACTDTPDARLDNTSSYFHEHMGYRLVGRFTKCGCKFGTWYDMIWMEKLIGGHPAAPQPFIPITDLMKPGGGCPYL